MGFLIEDESEVEKDDMGASILRSEFDAAIRDLQRNKAPGIDDIPAELIKYAGEKTNSTLQNHLRYILNRRYT